MERADGAVAAAQGADPGLPASAMPLSDGSEWLRLGGVALAVRDLDRMEAFYRYAIGLEDVAREPGLVRLGVGDHAFLDLLHRPDALPDDPAGAGLFHVAFLLPSRAHLGRWLAHAARLRLRLDGAADHLVSEAVYLGDPEGNGIEVYADRPRTAWRWTDVSADEGDGRAGGRRVEMANRPLDRAGLLREAEQDGRPWTGAPDGTSIGHVHLRVGDVAEAERFYHGVLGLDLTASWPDAAFLSTGGYHHHLGANTWRSRGAGPRDPHRAGLASVTFDVGGDVAGDVAGEGGRLPAVVAAHLGGDALLDPWGTALRFRAA